MKQKKNTSKHRIEMFIVYFTIANKNANLGQESSSHY